MELFGFKCTLNYDIFINYIPFLEVIDMQNLRCKIHPSEIISNFCTRDQCMVELCATCICQHTEMHNANGTLPHYENIVQTIQKANEAIDSQRLVIEDEKKRIFAFNQNWDKKKEEVHQKIKSAKKDVLDLVQRTFGQIQHRISQTFNQEEIKMGMRIGERASKMLETFNSQSSRLCNLQKDLIGIKGPETIKLLYSVVLPNSDQIIDKIQDDFSLLQVHDVKLEYFQQNLLDLKQRIANLVVLEIQIPDGISRFSEAPLTRFPEKTVIRQPMIEYIQRGPIELCPPMCQTCPTGFYSRPQSANKNISKSFVVVNGNGQTYENRPKLSVISGKMTEYPVFNSTLRSSRKPNIFGTRSFVPNYIR